MPALNAAQLEIIKLFDRDLSEKDLRELKQVLIEFLAKKVVEEADKAFDEKGYSLADIEHWKIEHYKLKAEK
ncbi:MAG: hypothetical protein SFU99_02925 [Saprospiraceae bacterium]|nr:hypothetical protein [Saprospiraceae bacterium]